MRKLIYIAGMVAILAAVFVVVQRARPNPLPSPQPAPAPAPAPEATSPTITWSVPQLTQTMFPGTSSTVSVSFQSDQNLTGVAVEITPSLSGIVSVNPASFASVAAKQPYQITFTLTAPAAFIRRSFGGTVHVRNAGTPARTYDTPLPINLQTGWNSASITGSLTMNYPVGWFTQQSSSTTLFRNVQDPSTVALENLAFFEVSYLAQANPNGIPIDQWFSQVSQSAPFPPISVNSISIGGHFGVIITVPEIGADTKLFISRGADVIEVTYNTEAQQFVGDYAAMLNSTF